MDHADCEPNDGSSMSGQESVSEDGSSWREQQVVLPKEIKENFLAAAADFSFNGTYAYSHTYSIDETPRPCLNISGLGTIGLPLSPRDAQCIVSLLERESTSQNAAPKERFELPSDQIIFENPAWEKWIQKDLLTTVCAALDVRNNAKLKCRLEKLSLLGGGSDASSFFFLRDSLPSKDNFGSVIVILPSPFTGGLIQVSENDRNKAFDLAPHSALSTSVVAAYAGVEVTFEPVLSGYRLALHYSLTSVDEGASFPRLPELPAAAAAKLRETLLSWKEFEKDREPTAVLAYLLQSSISTPTKVGSKVLVGCDADLLLYLLPIAHDFDFEVYLADATLSVSGETDLLPSGHVCVCESCIDPRLGASYDNRLKISDLEVDNFDEGELYLRNFIDGDGIPVEIRKLSLRKEEILNSESWRDRTPEMDSISRTTLEYVEYEYEYTRSILLLWSKRANRGVHVGDIYDYTCDALQLSTSPAASLTERKLVDLLLRRCREEQDLKNSVRAKMVTAMRVLYDSATRWNDVQLFDSAVKACPAGKRIDLVGIETFVNALRTFSWTTLKDILILALTKKEDDDSRYKLIRRVSEVAKEMNNSEIDKWCNDQVEMAILSIKTVDLNRVDWLLSLAKERGADFFRDAILPQLLIRSPIAKFWLSFVRQLDEQKDFIPTSSPHVVENLISQCVELAAQTCFFGTSSIDNEFMQVIELYVSTKNVEKCSALFENIKSACRIGSYYERGSASLDSYLEANPELNAFSHVFRVFYENAAVFLITERSKSCRHTTFEMTVKRAGGAEQVLKRIDTETIRELVKGKNSDQFRSFSNLVSSMPHSDKAKKDVARFLNAYSLAYVDNMDLSLLYKQNTVRGANKGARELMDVFYDVGTRESLIYLSRRLLPLLDSCDAELHFRGVLMPLLPLLKNVLGRRNLSVAFLSELSVGMAKHIAKALLSLERSTCGTQHVPFGCGCVDCLTLSQFLSSNEQTMSFQRANNIKDHLKGQLSKSKVSQRGVSWKVQSMERKTDPILQVSKPAHATLNSYVAEGRRFLELLGNSDSQKQILGADYGWAHAVISGLPLSATDMQRYPYASSAGQKRPTEEHLTNVDTGAATLPKKPRLT